MAAPGDKPAALAYSAPSLPHFTEARPAPSPPSRACRTYPR